MAVSVWTHAACTPCYKKRHPDQEIRNNIAPLNGVRCCYCNILTRSGLYDRNNPKETPCEGATGIHTEP